MAVLTDAHNGNALARLRKTDLFCFFDYVISFDMTGAKKPAPDAFLLALKKLGTLPSETLLVGDSLRRDIAPAQQLGDDCGIREIRGPECPHTDSHTLQTGFCADGDWGAGGGGVSEFLVSTRGRIMMFPPHTMI